MRSLPEKLGIRGICNAPERTLVGDSNGSTLAVEIRALSRLSKFAAQVFGNPSSSVKTTSVGILRIVEVMGATVTEFSTAIAESRVRIRTGRFLSGALNVYQHTSPRFTMLPSPVR